MVEMMMTRPSSKGPSNKHKQLARLLQTAIEHRRKIPRMINLDLWSLQVQKLCEGLNQPKAEARVYRVIKFLNQMYSEYGIHSEQLYIPTVESVRSLREKFGRIEDAMARQRTIHTDFKLLEKIERVKVMRSKRG